MRGKERRSERGGVLDVPGSCAPLEIYHFVGAQSAAAECLGANEACTGIDSLIERGDDQCKRRDSL